MSKLIDNETIQVLEGETLLVYTYQGRTYVTVGKVCTGDEDECTHYLGTRGKQHLTFASCLFSSLPLSDEDDDGYTIHHIQQGTPHNISEDEYYHG